MSTTAVSSTASATASTGTSTETQAGISSACNSFATAVAGDTCINFAKSHGIEPAQLYAWNPVLGSGGANSATLFWANESYYIGVGTSSASDVPGVPQSPQSSDSSEHSDMSSAMYTATAPGSTIVMVTPIPPSSMVDSLEDMCRSTVTSIVTQTITETVYETGSAGLVPE